MNTMKAVTLTLGMVFVLAACSSEQGDSIDEDRVDAETPVVDEGGEQPEVPTSGESDETALVGATWQWVSLVEMEPAAQSVVPLPENYTV